VAKSVLGTQTRPNQPLNLTPALVGPPRLLYGRCRLAANR